MKVGDLVKSTMTRRDDVGVVLTIGVFNGEPYGRESYGQATVGWSTGQIQYFDLVLLKVINESR